MKKHEYGVEYETLDELLSSDPIEIYEDEDNYYFSLKPDGLYDNSMWVVDKKSKNVSFMYFTQFIVERLDKARKITINEIEKT